MDKVIFLGFFVSLKEAKVDESKIDVIKSWTIPKFITNVRSIHGLASFYWKFTEVI